MDSHERDVCGRTVSAIHKSIVRKGHSRRLGANSSRSRVGVITFAHSKASPATGSGAPPSASGIVAFPRDLDRQRRPGLQKANTRGSAPRVHLDIDGAVVSLAMAVASQIEGLPRNATRRKVTVPPEIELLFETIASTMVMRFSIRLAGDERDRMSSDSARRRSATGASDCRRGGSARQVPLF